jgi:hypothetical protein
MVRIVFWENQLCERGTSVSTFNYAYYNRQLLGNESIIMYDISNDRSDPEVVRQFQTYFQVIGITHFCDVDKILSILKCDIFYIIKCGPNDGKISNVCKTVVHCVFNYLEPHGNVYAGISPWIKGWDGSINCRVVPHMIDLPNKTNQTFRQELNIPEEAVVFGRHGGYAQFDIPFVQETVYYVAKENPHIYFLFVNTQPFCPSLPNIIYLSKIIDLTLKEIFINTCDAMIWGRSDGETFGLAIGEFSIKNKPVFATFHQHMDLAHVHLLGEKGIWYNEHSLKEMLVNFNKTEMAKKDWNAFQDYTPEKVMEVFKKIFIDG